MNASKLIKGMTNDKTDVIKEVLNDIRNCKVDAKIKNNLLIVKIFLFGKVKEITPVISVPSIKETSPALAYA